MSDGEAIVNRHGQPPYTVAVVHGGPGAAGEVAPVAHELAARGHGVLEPIQTVKSVTAQVDELALQLKQFADGPVVLIGWSWGAWLSGLLTAEHPALVSALVLVGSGPFEIQHATEIKQIRHTRLTEAETAERAAFFDGETADTPENLRRELHLTDKSDAYALIDHADVPVDFDREIFNSVWPEAEHLRRSGILLRKAATITCPVIAIHGDTDPHPYQGVETPLKSALERFEFILLQKCGHKPWFEKHARDAFFSQLETTISTFRVTPAIANNLHKQ